MAGFKLINHWQDIRTLYNCKIIENSLGFLCGYVRVPTSHPYHGIGCDDSICGHPGCDEHTINVDLHGGLTFSESMDDDDDWWFGFVSGMAGDGHKPGSIMAKAPGFENNDNPYRNADYVGKECLKLAEQLWRASHGRSVLGEIRTVVQILTIDQAQPLSTNAVIDMAKSHWGQYSKEKKIRTQAVALLCRVQKLHPVQSPPAIRIWFWQRAKRIEKDNLLINTKYLIDGLVMAGILLDDRWDNYTDLDFRFRIDRDNPRIIVEVIEKL